MKIYTSHVLAILCDAMWSVEVNLAILWVLLDYIKLLTCVYIADHCHRFSFFLILPQNHRTVRRRCCRDWRVDYGLSSSSLESVFCSFSMSHKWKPYSSREEELGLHCWTSYPCTGNGSHHSNPEPNQWSVSQLLFGRIFLPCVNLERYQIPSFRIT